MHSAVGAFSNSPPALQSPPSHHSAFRIRNIPPPTTTPLKLRLLPARRGFATVYRWFVTLDAPRRCPKLRSRCTKASQPEITSAFRNPHLEHSGFRPTNSNLHIRHIPQSAFRNRTTQGLYTCFEAIPLHPIHPPLSAIFKKYRFQL